MERTMEKRNYYYLVAGLPELVLEQSKIPFSPAGFIGEIRKMLHPEDLQRVEWLMYPFDHHKLLNLVFKTSLKGKSFGKFSSLQLEDGLKEPGSLPAYMDRFYRAYLDEMPIWPQMSWENQLTQLYFDQALVVHKEGFLRDWLVFENHLRNILAAWNIREFRMPAEGQFIGHEDVVEDMLKSHARDFGLLSEFPFLDKLLQVLEQQDLLEREKAIDRIKWSYIDELNTFNYFTIDVVLGYLLKLIMLERWLDLDVESGQAAINNVMANLEGSFEFPIKFDAV